MSKSVKKKMVIELVYDNKEEALKLLKKINYNNINELASMKFHSNNAYMQTQLTFFKPLVEPKTEIINGKNYLVFPSSMNF